MSINRMYGGGRSKKRTHLLKRCSLRRELEYVTINASCVVAWISILLPLFSCCVSICLKPQFHPRSETLSQMLTITQETSLTDTLDYNMSI